MSERQRTARSRDVRLYVYWWLGVDGACDVGSGGVPMGSNMTIAAKQVKRVNAQVVQIHVITTQLQSRLCSLPTSNWAGRPT
jgi:hypothetical protein